MSQCWLSGSRAPNETSTPWENGQSGPESLQFPLEENKVEKKGERVVHRIQHANRQGCNQVIAGVMAAEHGL